MQLTSHDIAKHRFSNANLVEQLEHRSSHLAAAALFALLALASNSVNLGAKWKETGKSGRKVTRAAKHGTLDLPHR